MQTTAETTVNQANNEVSIQKAVGVNNGKTNGIPADSTSSGRTLYRNSNDKVVAGVCGGMADFLGIDTTLVRVAWVVLTLATGGGGILAYLALWLLLPAGTQAEGKLQPAAIELNDKTLARTAYLLIALGGLWFLANIGVLPGIWSAVWSVLSILFWPALLIAAGYLLLRNSGRNWRGDVDGVTGKVRSSVDGKVPSSDEMRDGFASARRHFPLKRSTDDRIFMGVCGGIGEKLGIDANLVRLIWAALSVGSIGVGVILYVALGLLLPQESALASVNRTNEPQDVTVVDGTVS